MTYPIEFSTEAAEELEVAARWFDEQRPGLGEEFLSAVDEALALIARWPHSGTLTDSGHERLEVRRSPVARFRFQVNYGVIGDRIRVLAISHDHRKPGYWRARSPE